MGGLKLPKGGKNWTLGGTAGQKSSKIVGYHLSMIPMSFWKKTETKIFAFYDETIEPI